MPFPKGKPAPKRVFLYMSTYMHNAYRHMLENAPEGFEITPSEFMAYGPFRESRARGSSLWARLESLKPKLSGIYNRVHIAFGVPKIRECSIGGYDLIHSGQSLLKTKCPYVADFEHATVFSGYNQYAFSNGRFLRALKRTLLDKKLKKLLPWSNAARDSLLNFVRDREIAGKTETVYPVVTPVKSIRRRRHRGVNFIFVGGMFFEKGGYDSVLAFDKVSRKYDAKLTVVSGAPADVVGRFRGNRKIRFMGTQPYDVVKTLYLESDVMLFPSHYDTFGFVIPEAFSHGLPVISVDDFSRRELIENGRTGLLVKGGHSYYNADGSFRYGTMSERDRVRSEECRSPEPGYIKALSGSISSIIEDGRMRRRLSSNARKEALEGKFSPKTWKREMGRIYAEALRI